MSKEGFVYVLSNKTLDVKSTYKIGYTTRKVKDRVKEINKGTGVIEPLEEYWSIETTSAYELERVIHKDLAEFRIDNKKEFFKCPLELIKERLIPKSALLEEKIKNEVTTTIKEIVVTSDVEKNITILSDFISKEQRDLLIDNNLLQTYNKPLWFMDEFYNDKTTNMMIQYGSSHCSIDRNIILGSKLLLSIPIHSIFVKTVTIMSEYYQRAHISEIKEALGINGCFVFEIDEAFNKFDRSGIISCSEEGFPIISDDFIEGCKMASAIYQYLNNNFKFFDSVWVDFFDWAGYTIDSLFSFIRKYHFGDCHTITNSKYDYEVFLVKPINGIENFFYKEE